MSIQTRRLRAYSNGPTKITHRMFDVHFETHETRITVPTEERYDALERGDPVPPAEMYTRYTHNVSVTITTAGTAQTFRVSGVTTESPLCHVELLDEVIAHLQKFRAEHVNEDANT
jgi:hypothetical protein